MGIPLTHFLSLIVMRCSFLDSIYSSFLPPSLSSSINRMRDLFSNLETVSTDLRWNLPDCWIVNAKLVAYSADQILCKLQQLLLDKDAAMASNLLGSSEIDDEINWVIRVLEELLVSGEIKIGYSGVLAHINPSLSEQEVGKLLHSGNPSQPGSEKYKLLMKPSVLMDVPESVNGFFNPIYNRRLRQASPFTLITSLHLSGLSGFVELPWLHVLQSLRISGCERLNAVSICEKFSAVEALEISCCPELTSLSGLNQLLSLRSLSLSFCFNLQFDLHVQLPPLLEYLDLTHCPSLEEWCQNAGLQNRKLDETIESFQRSSPVGFSPVYGRENEKNSIIEFLLSDDFNRRNLTVVCILGESGIGKTSLAHLIYSEERVLDSFDARMFITMTENSDETRLINKLIESVTGSPCPMTEADLLEELLIDELTGTKVFIVLDDAENENPCFWNRIITILNHSTRGSVLLVTTESKDVAEVIGAMKTYYLDPLSDYYCWKIFCQHIFTSLGTNANTDLVETGKQLLSKCQHNPLCIKVLAGLFVCSKNEESWAEILKTDLWDMDGFDGDTLPTLRVGYELLPNNLKKCLQYCSLFPKDYVFAKQQIVCMWMSQGFIFPVEGRQPEEVGLQNFDELLLRGFFQHSPLHDVEEDKFIMHDLICALIDLSARIKYPPTKDALERIIENCFHFSLNPSKIQIDKMKPLIKEDSDLQSFLALTTLFFQIRINFSILDISSLSDLFTKCINLRTLDLSCTDIVELPGSVGMLKQLRYLGVNNTKIRSIPRELCSLVNLQTLEAKDCQHLVELPETMMELKNLRHLDVSKKSGSVKMMIGIGQLTNLQSLAVFCVGCEMSYCSIRELKDLNCLSSCLQIAGLENVTNGLDAKEAALHNKVHLNTLWLHWNDNNTFTESEGSITISEEVLNNLKPNPKIGELIIRNYRGNLFPTWMGDPSFTKLVSIILDKCLNCSQFPALGGLPSLRHLSVQKLYHLVRLENTENQFVSQNTPKFPSLETLNLWEMYDLEELFETSDRDFPSLRTLSINRCPMLKRVPCFSSLLNLSLYCSLKLPYLPDFPSLKSLRIDGFQKIKSIELPKDLRALKELEIRHCNELLLVEGLQKLPSLKKLNVVHCPKFDSLKNWKPCHSKPTSTTRWFFPKEESTTQMEHQETSEPAECKTSFWSKSLIFRTESTDISRYTDLGSVSTGTDPNTNTDISFYGDNSDASAIFSDSSDEFPTSPLSCASIDSSDDLIDSLVAELSSPSNDIESLRRAAIELRLVAKHNLENRIRIVRAGAVRPLICLLYHQDPILQENGVTALLNLSLCDENKALIAEAGAIRPLVSALKWGPTAAARENAACALLRLSQLDGLATDIGRAGAIPLLINLLETSGPRGKKDAATTLYSLCDRSRRNKLQAVQHGAVQPLLELMADSESGMVDKAAYVLDALVTTSEGRHAAVQEGGIPVLVEMVKAGTQRQKEIATLALLQICEDSSTYRTMVAREGAIPPLVALSQSSNAKSKLKTKAEALIELLRQPKSTTGRSRGWLSKRKYKS